MKRWLLLWCLTLSCWAGPAYDLGALLSWQRRSYAPAVVTSGFFDSRGVSRYRSRPGLHLGYDIAMPYGAPALAAWPGVVTAVVPWYGAEYGVTVLHADGTTATYGHIVPSVGCGSRVEPGTVVGTIASDHLDVKMRDGNGIPYDFGSGATLALSAPAPAVDPLLEWRAARSRLIEFLKAEARRETPQRRFPELEARGLRVASPAKSAPARTQELEKAWQAYRKLPGKPAGWAERSELEAQWQQARTALTKAEQMYAAGLLSRKRWQQARDEEQRRRKLATIARSL